MKKQRKIHACRRPLKSLRPPKGLQLLAIAAIGLLFLSWGRAIPPALGAPKEPLPVELMEQWQKIKAEAGPDTGRVAELLVEGGRIIARLQELDDLRRSPSAGVHADKSSATAGFDERIAQLQNRFRDLLRSIEMTRVAGLPNADLEAMKARYEEERQRLQAETRALEDTILSRSEQFLATYKQNVNYAQFLSKQEMIADFLYRLAEIYYRRGEEQFFATNDVATFKPALEKYQRIIDEFPASEYVDDALYNIAYVKNNSRSPDDQQEAIRLYKTLIDKYADSPFVPEAYWRVAEYYFYQDPFQLEEALKYYGALLDFPDTHWYARGLYKIGWCHFKNNDYAQAVEYFTKTVEASVDSASGSQDILFASMLDEAMEYISVCFATEEAAAGGGGVPAAIKFVQADTLRRETYGQGILEHLGDIYTFQTGKYNEAVQSYQALLDLYPLAKEAPWIQEKIITCYNVHLRDFARAYEAKNALFATYRAGTEWDHAYPDSALRAGADEIIEKYYAQNISETIGRALEANDAALFATAVQMSRDYLQFFPAGPNAYTVNFNMAILLEQNVQDGEQAYVEYLKVSNEYADDSHRKESAVNAAIIAQRMINSQHIPNDSLMGQPLTEAEQKFVAAAQNYLKLFPQGEEAEVFLLSVGSIYYNHGGYADSRSYLEKQSADFPAGNRRGDAYRLIMNGYFAEKNYTEAERVAKNIQSAGFDSTLLAAAKVRQAESVFLTAAGLKVGEHYLESAAEFKRTAMESPDYAQADKALFESGLAYQQGKAWREANEVYLLLAARYPQSELADKALYNTAYNSQSELADKAGAAATYERLARVYPQSPLAQDAVRNASIAYVEAQDWAGAIRVNGLYTEMFATAADANIYLFESAGLYLKMGDEASAERIYGDYSRLYPNDPRAVRAHWERGNFLQERGRNAEAKAEFGTGIQTHRTMVSAGGAGEETYASRCLLEVTQGDLADYGAIRLAPAAEVEASKRIKLGKRDALLAELAELNSLGKDEMLEGLFTVGQVEEDLAQAFENQELTAKGSAEERILAREVADQDAIEIAVRAMAAYAKAGEEIGKAEAVLEHEATELKGHKEALTEWVAQAQKSVPQPEALPDSTTALAAVDHGLQEVSKALENAVAWSRKAVEKLPELAFHNAQIKHAIVRAFLALPDAGKTDELKVAYRAAVIGEFAAPRGAEVVRLYARALGAAGASVDSSAWRQKSLDGMQELCANLEGEYRALNERALGAYAQNLSDYQYLLTREEGATNARGLQAADVAEKLVFYSGQSLEMAKAALEAQGALLAAAGENADKDRETQRGAVGQLAALALDEVFRIADRYKTLAGEAQNLKTTAEGRKAESVVWEDASMTFEDCAYNFNQQQEALLSAALEFNQAHGADQALALRISWALVGLNRQSYLPLLAQYGQELWVRSDESFRASPHYFPNWESLNCSEKDWVAPAVVSEAEAVGSELADSKALWISASAPSDSALTTDSGACDSLYLRKTFDIAQEPVAGDLWIAAEGEYAVQVNGELVAANQADSGPAGMTAAAHYNVAEYLKSGQNLLAVFAIGPAERKQGDQPGVRLALRYKVLPLQTYGGP